MNHSGRLLLGLLLATATLFAQDNPATRSRSQDDPPGRVARLQYMNGAVSIQPSGTGEWVAGSTNRPLTTSDNIWTDKDSRAELSVGTGVMRMGSESSMTLANVSDGTVQMQLHQGTLNLHVRRLFRGEVYEIDTPNLAFTVQKSGDYRFDVDPNGDTTVVTVWRGEGDATGQGPAVRIHSDERLQFSGGTSLAYQALGRPRGDGFDDWCRVRDRRQDSSYSARYVSPGVIGYEDLDDYGSWRVSAAYGPIWVPAVSPGWAPYRYGHWIWVDPWGWTWVDDAPWGFAPFHYGRWVYYNNYWGWAPGPYYARPYYAPALVTWFGGPGWGVSVGFGGFGGFGWCPLGWGEPFYPWYHAGPRYFRTVNITNTRFVNFNHFANGFGHHGFVPDRHFANVNRPGGLTAASAQTIAAGRPIGHNFVNISDRQAGNSLGGRIPLSPTQASRLGPNAGRPTAAPMARVAGRPTVSRITPPAGRFGSSAPAARGASNFPEALNRSGRNDVPFTSRTGSVASGTMRSVPRPPNREMTAGLGRGSEVRARQGGVPPMSRAVPRPRNATGFARSAASANREMGSGFRGAGDRSVPRPMGTVLPASRDAGAVANRSNATYSVQRGGYSAGSRGDSGGYRGSYVGDRDSSRSSYGSYRTQGSYGPSRESAPGVSARGSYGGSAPSMRGGSSSGGGYRGGYSGGGRSAGGYAGGGGHASGGHGGGRR